ncbi:MAG: polysaccharide biosynthesis C-terminal domain-containing protein [Chitinophagaceae bacterium]
MPALGLGHVLLRYAPIWKEQNILPRFHRFAMIVMSLALLLFALLFYIFKANLIRWYSGQSALFLPYAFLIVPLVAIFTFTQYFELFAMIKMRVAVPAFLREIVTRLLLILLLYAFALQWISETQWVYGLVLVYAISGFILFFYVIKTLEFRIAPSAQFYQTIKERREILGYAGTMLLMLTAGNLHNFIDGIILPAYLGLGALGIYMRPLVLGQMIQVPYRAISLISIPVIREALVVNDITKVRDLNKSIGLNLFLIGTFLFAGLCACADALFAMLPEQYAEGRYVLYIIGFGRLIDMAFGLNSEILNYSNYYKLMLYLTLGMMAITIGLDVLLIPHWGMNGAALAVSISLTLFNILKSILIYKHYRFHCFSSHYITLMVIMLAVIGLMQMIPILTFIEHHMFFNAGLNVVFKGALSTLMFLIPTYLLKVSPDLNHFMQLVWSGQIFKGGHKMESL